MKLLFYKMFFILFFTGISNLYARPGFGDSSPVKYFKKTRQKGSKDNSPRTSSKENSPGRAEEKKSPNLSPLRLFNAIRKSRSKDDVSGPASSGIALDTSTSLENIPAYHQAGLEPVSRTRASENLKKSRSTTTLNRIRPIAQVPSLDVISNLILMRGHPTDRAVATSQLISSPEGSRIKTTPRCVAALAVPLALQKPPLKVFTPSHNPLYRAQDHILDFHKIQDADCIKFSRPGSEELSDEMVQNIFSACILEFDKIKAVEFGVPASLNSESFLCLVSFENIQQLNFYQATMSINTLRVICSHLPRLSHLNVRELEAPELLSDFQKHYPILLDALGLLKKLEELDLSALRGLDGFTQASTADPGVLKPLNKNLRVLLSYAPLGRFVAEGWPLDQETVFLLFLSKSLKSVVMGPVYLHSDFFKKYKLAAPFCCLSLSNPIDQEGNAWGSQEQWVDLKSALPKLKLLRLRAVAGLSAQTIAVLKSRGLDLSLSDEDDLNYVDPYSTWGYDGQAFDL